MDLQQPVASREEERSPRNTGAQWHYLPPSTANGVTDYLTANAHTDGETHTATVLVLGALQPELEGFSQRLPDIATEHLKRQEYKYCSNPPGSPFVNANPSTRKSVGTGTGGNGRPPVLPGSTPPNFGIGGFGGSDDVRPDDVPDIFRLDQIGGLDEQKDYLKRSIILPLVCPHVLKDWGVSPPKGILLHGPPGTGKTFMAKALVNELKQHLGRNVKFFYRKGGDVFTMWFGESQRKLRQVFEAAKSMQPSVIFFDEIDGLCPSRDGRNHGTEAYASVVTCFLGQMDGLENGKVFVIAATNRLDAVDPAVRRPGRFDKHLAFGFPDETARRQIIQIHTNKWDNNDRPSQNDITSLAQETIGFTGADLEKMCKDVVYAAIAANNGVTDSSVKVEREHWTQAINGMQRTATNNFGSSLFMPTKPNQIISKLIEPAVGDVIRKVKPMLTDPSINLSPTQFPTLHKSLLIHIKLRQSKTFLNNHILNGILSYSLFNGMALFEISTTTISNKLLSYKKPTVLSVVIDVVNQAYDAQQTEKCVVVVIPNINEILEMKPAHASPTLILNALAKIRGPKMFLLATSSVPLDAIQDVRLTELFGGQCIAAANPKADQLSEFFKFVLETKKVSFNRRGNLLQEVANEAAKYADSDNYEHILNLATSIAQVNIAEEESYAEVKKKFSDLLDKYQVSKLL